MKDQTVDLPIEQLTIASLLVRQNDVSLALTLAKAADGEVKAEVARRLGESAKRALEQAEKTHGTTTLQLQDGVAAKAEVKQTVKWDSAKLQAIAQTLPWERVVALFKIDFSMSETIYKGVAALSPEMREKIDAARTTKLGEPSVTLVAAN